MLTTPPPTYMIGIVLYSALALYIFVTLKQEKELILRLILGILGEIIVIILLCLQIRN